MPTNSSITRRGARRVPDRSRVASRLKQTPKVDDLPELMVVPEFMQAMRLGRTAVYQMIAEGKIPVVRIGRHVRIPRSVLQSQARGEHMREVTAAK